MGSAARAMQQPKAQATHLCHSKEMDRPITRDGEKSPSSPCSPPWSEDCNDDNTCTESQPLFADRFYRSHRVQHICRRAKQGAGRLPLQSGTVPLPCARVPLMIRRVPLPCAKAPLPCGRLPLMIATAPPQSGKTPLMIARVPLPCGNAPLLCALIPASGLCQQAGTRDPSSRLRCGRSPTEPHPPDRRSPVFTTATGENSDKARMITGQRTPQTPQTSALTSPLPRTCLTPPLQRIMVILGMCVSILRYPRRSRDIR